jgi:hypothetical protein
VAATCRDGTAQVWETGTGNPITPRFKLPWGADIRTLIRFIFLVVLLLLGLLLGALGNHVPIQEQEAVLVIRDLPPDREEVRILWEIVKVIRSPERKNPGRGNP